MGNKVFKDRKLKRLITSEEYKFGSLFEQKVFEWILINFMKDYLSFYLNKGYYNIVNSSFAKLLMMMNLS